MMNCKLLILLAMSLAGVLADRDKLTGLSFTFPSDIKIQKETELCIRFENMNEIAYDHVNLTIHSEPFELIEPMEFQVYAKTKLSCFDIKLGCSNKLISNDIRVFQLKVVAHQGSDKYCFEKEISIKESGKQKCLEKARRSLMAMPDPSLLEYLLKSMENGPFKPINQITEVKKTDQELTTPMTTSASVQQTEPIDEDQIASEEETSEFKASDNFEVAEIKQNGADGINETLSTVTVSTVESISKENKNTIEEENEPSNETRALLIKTIKPFDKPTIMNAIVALPDELIAIGASDSTIQIWDTKTSTLNKTFVGHTGRVMALSLMPNGDIVSGSSDRTIRVWDADTGVEKLTIKAEAGGYIVLETLDRDRLAVGFSDMTIKIWNMTTSEQLLNLVGHSRKIYSLTKLENGDLVSGSADKTIKVWNTTDGTLKHTFVGHIDSVESLCALPGGRFASGSWDATIKIWNSEEGRLEQTLEGHTDSIFALVLLPNGDLVSGSLDKTIKVWNPIDGKLKRSIDIYHYGVRRMTLLSNGNLATIGYTEQKVKVWNTTALSEPMRY